MIIVRVPLRLPLGGGGTDLPDYREHFGGHLITASIDKYIYITINQPVTSDKIKLFYSQIEEVDSVDQVKHNIIRECLNLFNVKESIEINTSADLAGSTGMGSSSAFTVGLILGLSKLYNINNSNEIMSELACHVEIDILKSPIGKQDHYASALGGVNELLISKSNRVEVNPVEFDYKKFEDRLLMFYTNTQRSANEVLKEVNIEGLHEIKQIGNYIHSSLISNDVDTFGELLHQHWLVKRSMSSKMSTEFIDSCYQKALNNGVIGGKIMGAGGGGFLLLCCQKGRRETLKNEMSKYMKFMDFKFEFEGAKIIL